MTCRFRVLGFVLGALIFVAIGQRAEAAAPGCGQARVETLLGAPAPPGPSLFYIAPNSTVTPFYQWENNNGYCGEVSLMSAGLSNGQWISQYNMRLVCGGFFGPETNGSGPALLQAGNPPGRRANYNAQLLIEDPSQGFTGPYDFDWAGRCAANAGLSLVQYPANTGYLAPNTGLAGYQDFMSWVKAQIMAGHQVAIGVLINDDTDPQYDHIVTVIRIGTNHSPSDPSYYPDDVIYFEDHGAYTLKVNDKGTWSFASNPGVPPGAGDDRKGCTPYIFAYEMGSFVRTRAQENAQGAPAYAVVMPDGGTTVRTENGNTASNGNGTVAVPGPHDTAFAITGPLDTQAVTLPVSLAIVGTSSLVRGRWVPNPPDENSLPAAGYNYENPYIGGNEPRCNYGQCASNAQPDAMKMILEATVHGLTAGVAYRLYEYDFPEPTGALTGFAAALPIPTSDFNARRGEATYMRAFVARGAMYSTGLLERSSREIVVFRAVRADAP